MNRRMVQFNRPITLPFVGITGSKVQQPHEDFPDKSMLPFQHLRLMHARMHKFASSVVQTTQQHHKETHQLTIRSLSQYNALHMIMSRLCL